MDFDPRLFSWKSAEVIRGTSKKVKPGKKEVGKS